MIIKLVNSKGMVDHYIIDSHILDLVGSHNLVIGGSLGLVDIHILTKVVNCNFYLELIYIHIREDIHRLIEEDIDILVEETFRNLEEEIIQNPIMEKVLEVYRS